jgi:ectoine hydroxylase-related dioxygenase (phytanoyl-CoA dioxygenase family)
VVRYNQRDEFMRSYLSLKEIANRYFGNLRAELRVILGVYYLEKDIENIQNFYGNHYLADALQIETLPSLFSVLDAVELIGNGAISISLEPDQQITENIHSAGGENSQDFLKEDQTQDGKSTLRCSHAVQAVILEIESRSKVYKKESDPYAVQDVQESTLENFRNEGFAIVKSFLKPLQIEELKRSLETVASNEREAGEAYLYGKNGQNQRVYNLLSKQKCFRDLLNSVFLNDFMNTVFNRLTYHEKYGLSSMAAHIIPPGGEAMPLHIDSAVPDPIPEWMIRVVAVLTLSDFSENTGGTYVIPKSHKKLRRPYKDEDMETRGIHLEAPAGSLVIWDGLLWHKSTTNFSNSNRYGIIISYGASFFKEICGEEEHLVVVPEHIKSSLSPRQQSLIGMGRGLKKGAQYNVQ